MMLTNKRLKDFLKTCEAGKRSGFDAIPDEIVSKLFNVPIRSLQHLYWRDINRLTVLLSDGQALYQYREPRYSTEGVVLLDEKPIAIFYYEEVVDDFGIAINIYNNNFSWIDESASKTCAELLIEWLLKESEETVVQTDLETVLIHTLACKVDTKKITEAKIFDRIDVEKKVGELLDVQNFLFLIESDTLKISYDTFNNSCNLRAFAVEAGLIEEDELDAIEKEDYEPDISENLADKLICKATGMVTFNRYLLANESREIVIL